MSGEVEYSTHPLASALTSNVTPTEVSAAFIKIGGETISLPVEIRFDLLSISVLEFSATAVTVAVAAATAQTEPFKKSLRSTWSIS
jgi:hypothetical protein